VDATNSVKIRADRHDDEDNNFAAGLSNCITKDGQTSITQNIPFNSRRIVSLADPIDPQDAATKDYADTKMPLDGSAPMTGDMIIKNPDPSITLDGTAGSKNSIFGQKGDKNRWELVLGDATAESGSNAGSNFDLISYADDGTTVIGTALFGTRSTALLTVKADPTAALGISTKQYADAAAAGAAASKLPIAGGTITGALQVNGHFGAGQNLIYFGNIGSGGYLQWQGGGTYVLGGGGTVWHSGNFNPTSSVSNGRWAIIGDWQLPYNGAPGGPVTEPFSGGVMTGCSSLLLQGVPSIAIQYMRFRRLQLSVDGTNYFSIGYYG